MIGVVYIAARLSPNGREQPLRSVGRTALVPHAHMPPAIVFFLNYILTCRTSPLAAAQLQYTKGVRTFRGSRTGQVDGLLLHLRTHGVTRSPACLERGQLALAVAYLTRIILQWPGRRSRGKQSKHVSENHSPFARNVTRLLCMSVLHVAVCECW